MNATNRNHEDLSDRPSVTLGKAEFLVSSSGGGAAGVLFTESPPALTVWSSRD